MMVYNTFSTIDGIISYIFLPLFDVFVAICEILSFFYKYVLSSHILYW